MARDFAWMKASRRGVFSALGVLSLLGAGMPSPAWAVALQVTVDGVRNARGKVEICVFETEKGFPDCAGVSGAVARVLPAASGRVQADFDVAPGPHAVSVLHDENGNGRMDTNFFGIPTEGGGVSNNPKPRMGPPRYSEAVFTLPPEGAEIAITMVYP